MQPRHHITESASHQKKIEAKLKVMFAAPRRQISILDLDLFMLDNSTYQALHSGEERRKNWLNNVKNNRSSWNQRFFDLSGAEITTEQYDQYIKLSAEATNRLLNAHSVTEASKVRDWFQERLSKILLPQQAALVFQKRIAENGLVFFLTRADVANDFAIDELQKHKLRQAGVMAAKELRKQRVALRENTIKNALKTLPQHSRISLAKKMGFTYSKFATFLATNPRASLFQFDKEPFYIEMKGSDDLTDGIGIDSQMTAKQEKLKRLYQILKIDDAKKNK